MQKGHVAVSGFIGGRFEAERPEDRDRADLGLSALQQAKQLRSLSLGLKGVPSELAALRELPQLHTLILGIKDADDFPGLEKLTQLRVLGLTELPRGRAALVRVSSLGKLKTLIVPKRELKRRKAELELLQGVIPGLQLRGFCIGLRHILLVLTLGVLLGLLLRWRRRLREA